MAKLGVWMQLPLDVRHLALRGLVGSSVLCLDSSFCTSVPCRAFCEMAPHLGNVELDMVTRLSADKKSPEEILADISKRRRKMKIVAPKIWAVRRAVAGVTHKRGVVEARGRKKKWNAVQTNRVFVKRRKMQHNTLHDSIV